MRTAPGKPRILVDADACPVRREAKRAAEEFAVEIIFFANQAQEVDDGSRGEFVRVGDGSDAADFAILTRCDAGDVVITDDFGLAAMALGKGAAALSSRGRRFRPEEMPQLLQQRHAAAKARRAGLRTRGPRGLKPDDRRRFVRSLSELLRVLGSEL